MLPLLFLHGARRHSSHVLRSCLEERATIRRSKRKRLGSNSCKRAPSKSYPEFEPTTISVALAARECCALNVWLCLVPEIASLPTLQVCALKPDRLTVSQTLFPTRRLLFPLRAGTQTLTPPQETLRRRRNGVPGERFSHPALAAGD